MPCVSKEGEGGGGGGGVLPCNMGMTQLSCDKRVQGSKDNFCEHENK